MYYVFLIIAAFFICCLSCQYFENPTTIKVQNNSVLIDNLSDWKKFTAEKKQIDIRENENIGEVFDLLGNGSLLLRKTDISNG